VVTIFHAYLIFLFSRKIDLVTDDYWRHPLGISFIKIKLRIR